MRGESLDSVELTFTGLPYDRRWSFVQSRSTSWFPWLTGRESGVMLRCQPFWDTSGPRPALSVRTPDDREHDIASEELRAYLERESGRPVHLHSDHRGCQDVAYVSVISDATVLALASAGGVEPDHRRFRMNFVVAGVDEPFTEGQWVGRELQIGGARLAIHEQDRRCQMITLDPSTGESTPTVLKQAGELNNACAGVYASVLATGPVNLGDEVRLS